MLTAGLRCAPDTAPMNMMMARTMRPGATTRAAAGMASPPNLAFTIPAPAATSTRRNVPSSSENTRRHSYWLSQKSNRRAKAFGSPIERSAIAELRATCCAAVLTAGGPVWLLLNGTPPQDAGNRPGPAARPRMGRIGDLTSAVASAGRCRFHRVDTRMPPAVHLTASRARSGHPDRVPGGGHGNDLVGVLGQQEAVRHGPRRGGAERGGVLGLASRVAARELRVVEDARAAEERAESHGYARGKPRQDSDRRVDPTRPDAAPRDPRGLGVQPHRVVRVGLEAGRARRHRTAARPAVEVRDRGLGHVVVLQPGVDRHRELDPERLVG